MAALLQVNGLRVAYPAGAGEVRAVDGVSFQMERGSVLGVVGESGCGKSTLACAIARILPEPGHVVGGEVLLDGVDVLRCPAGELRRLRREKMAMIFQDPAAALNPVMRVGAQLSENLRLRARLSHAEVRQRALRLLRAAGLHEPERCLRQYPHELSGGMRQRVMIALALCGEPELLIADEPTSALDVTIQAQILGLLRDLRARRHMAMLLVTHDLGVAAELCDEILVLYAGRVCERGGVEDIFYHPAHEYTRALLGCLPSLEGGRGHLAAIPGAPPRPGTQIRGCPFAPRCARAMPVCRAQQPEEIKISAGHLAACWRNVPGQGDGGRP